MSDELGKELMVEATKAVAVEAYKDAVQPALKAVGNIVALPIQAIDAALSGPKLWVAEKQYNFERTKELLAQKLKGVPAEQIVPPENYVAIPALQQISYCFDSDELRELYANLLAASMQEDKKWDVHPGFVDMIKQLCPDEAKVLRYLFAHDSDEVPTVTLRYENAEHAGIYILKHFSNVGELAGCNCPLEIGKYFDNFVRLGLVAHGPEMSMLADQSLYEPLKNHSYVQAKAAAASAEEEYNIPVIQESYLSMTDYGKSFCETCVGVPQEQGGDGNG